MDGVLGVLDTSSQDRVGGVSCKFECEKGGMGRDDEDEGRARLRGEERVTFC